MGTSHITWPTLFNLRRTSTNLHVPPKIQPKNHRFAPVGWLEQKNPQDWWVQWRFSSNGIRIRKQSPTKSQTQETFPSPNFASFGVLSFFVANEQQQKNRLVEKLYRKESHPTKVM